MDEEVRAYVQTAALVVTAVSTAISAYRAVVQRRQYRLEKAEARKEGLDPERAEEDRG